MPKWCNSGVNYCKNLLQYVRHIVRLFPVLKTQRLAWQEVLRISIKMLCTIRWNFGSGLRQVHVDKLWPRRSTLNLYTCIVEYLFTFSTNCQCSIYPDIVFSSLFILSKPSIDLMDSKRPFIKSSFLVRSVERQVNISPFHCLVMWLPLVTYRTWKIALFINFM